MTNAIAPSNARRLAAPAEYGRRLVSLRRCGPGSRQPEAGEPHAEERAAPFEEERRGGVCARRRSSASATSPVASRASDQRVRELGVFGPRLVRRVDPASSSLDQCSRYCSARSALLGAVEAVRVAGDRIECAQRPESPLQKPAIAPAYSRALVVPVLDCNPADHTRRAPGRPLDSASRGGRTGKTVLVVDDDQSLRLLCRVNLELDGYTVLEATGVDQAQDCSPPAASTPCSSTCTWATATAATSSTSLGADRPPVALFTGSEQIGPALREVADAVLSKPFEIRLLGDGRSTRVTADR